jgi:hypothetical protein
MSLSQAPSILTYRRDEFRNALCGIGLQIIEVVKRPAGPTSSSVLLSSVPPLGPTDVVTSARTSQYHCH